MRQGLPEPGPFLVSSRAPFPRRTALVPGTRGGNRLLSSPSGGHEMRRVKLGRDSRGGATAQNIRAWLADQTPTRSSAYLDTRRRRQRSARAVARCCDDCTPTRTPMRHPPKGKRWIGNRPPSTWPWTRCYGTVLRLTWSFDAPSSSATPRPQQPGRHVSLGKLRSRNGGSPRRPREARVGCATPAAASGLPSRCSWPFSGRWARRCSSHSRWRSCLQPAPPGAPRQHGRVRASCGPLPVPGPPWCPSSSVSSSSSRVERRHEGVQPPSRRRARLVLLACDPASLLEERSHSRFVARVDSDRLLERGDHACRVRLDVRDVVQAMPPVAESGIVGLR